MRLARVVNGCDIAIIILLIRVTIHIENPNCSLAEFQEIMKTRDRVDYPHYQLTIGVAQCQPTVRFIKMFGFG